MGAGLFHPGGLSVEVTWTMGALLQESLHEGQVGCLVITCLTKHRYGRVRDVKQAMTGRGEGPVICLEPRASLV